MVRRSHILLGCLAAVGALACGSSEGTPDEKLGGLVVSEESEANVIDVDRAAEDTTALVRAATMTHQQVGELLGGHVFRGTTETAVAEGDETVFELKDSTQIELRENGQFHAALKNSQDYGREVFFLDGQLLLAPRYGKFHRRPPTNEEEPATIRNELFASLGAHLELVAFAGELSDRGVQEVAGRDGRSIEIQLAPGSHEPPEQVLPRKKWRESITVEELSGTILLDADNGAPLKGDLHTVLAFSRDGRRFVMNVDVTHALEQIGQSPNIEPPPEETIVVVSDHHRELAEREQLLKGLAAPAKKAPTPQNTEASGK